MDTGREGRREVEMDTDSRMEIQEKRMIIECTING